MNMRKILNTVLILLFALSGCKQEKEYVSLIACRVLPRSFIPYRQMRACGT